MSLNGLVSALFVFVCCCWLVIFAADDHVSKPPAPTAAAAVANSTGTVVNTTDSGGKRTKGGPGGFSVDSSMIQRALYVLIAITLIGMLYFIVRAVRLKKPALKKKKYGLLSNYDDSVEMEGVESEEDDTLYEARSLRR